MPPPCSPARCPCSFTAFPGTLQWLGVASIGFLVLTSPPAQGNPGIVTCARAEEGRGHRFSDGDLVTFSGLEGMTELNGCKPRTVRVLGECLPASGGCSGSLAVTMLPIPSSPSQIPTDWRSVTRAPSHPTAAGGRSCRCDCTRSTRMYVSPPAPPCCPPGGREPTSGSVPPKSS